MKRIGFEFVKRTNNKYQQIRDRHYVDNNGTHGQQIHFLIHYNGGVIGIISGASAVYAVKDRDKYFNINKSNRKEILPHIINNNVFRLEKHIPNLATYILSRWRKLSAKIWEDIYGADVIGFETFVVEEDHRKGTLYKADNWIELGETTGSTKKHSGLKNKHKRIKTTKKLIFANKIKDYPDKKYLSSWRAETKEEKIRAKKLKKKRQSLYNKTFYYE